ncbi:MAG: SphA family protein [Hyphomicrobiales bacterium]
MKCLLGLVFILVCATCRPAQAVEGGFGLYQLGSRDLFAGIVPPPGIYWNNDIYYFTAKAPVIPIGGVAVRNPKLDAFVYKFNGTMVFPDTLFGGSVGLNVNMPFAKAKMDYSGVLGGAFPGLLSAQDKESGQGDLSINPIIGWHDGKLHYSLSMPIYFPTGKYSTATIDVRARTIDALRVGKNRFGVDPTLAFTYFDPQTGIDVSAAAGVTINTKNDKTNYQTAPEFHFEGTAAQHLANGLTFGGTFYAYQQLANDSGVGAQNIQRVTGATTLKARVFGAGPVVNYSTRIGTTAVSFKFKYLHEFGAKRRFESKVYWGTLGLAW